MDGRRIPVELEEPRFGQNTLDSAKKLLQHQSQKLINALPGISIKPRNGGTEVMHEVGALGYGSIHTLFSAESVHVVKNEKDYIITWHHGTGADNTKHGIEIWNVTDDARTVLDLGNFSTSGVHVSFTKLHDAIYMAIEREFTTNYTSQYRTRNKILDYISGAWVAREMGFNIVPNIQDVSAVVTAGIVLLGARTDYGSAVFLNKIWVVGGAKSTGTVGDVHYSPDGKRWTAVTPIAREYVVDGGVIVEDGGEYVYETITFPKRRGHKLIVFNSKLWMIGGQDESGDEQNDVWWTSEGETWYRHYTTPGWVARRYFGLVSHDSKLWIIGGFNAADAALSDVWNSTDGETWAEVTQTVPFTARGGHVAMAYNNTVYIHGGVGLEDVWSSADLATWTQVTADALLGQRAYHGAVVYDNKMWIAGGLESATEHNDVYSSTDGGTWTTVDASAEWSIRKEFVLLDFLSNLWVICGYGDSTYRSDGYYSDDGAAWTSSTSSLTPDKYYSYTWTFVRRKDEYAVLASMADYQYDAWEINGITQIVGIDEQLLTGTVSLSGTALTGSGSAFDTELVAGQRIRIDGQPYYYTISSITDATNAVVVNDDGDSYTDKKFALLPDDGDAISTETYRPGETEGIEDINLRRTIYTFAGEDFARVFLTVPYSAEALAIGVTHARLHRTLSGSSQTIAQGLSHRYLIDVALGTAQKTVRDDTADVTLAGVTYAIEVTGLSVPPVGRYSFWDGGRLWIGGNPDSKGFWYASQVPSNTQYPQKYASLFDLDNDYVTCDPDDGQQDSGGFEFLGDAYFCKERKIYGLSGADVTGTPYCISPYIGVACPNSIAKGNDPTTGEPAVFFLSESGPAILTAGGKVRLMHEFRISELWPRGAAGPLKRSTGAATNWYTRNKVSGAYWLDTYWLLYGDSEDTDCQITTNKGIGIHYAQDGSSYGGFELAFASPLESGAVIFEPIMLVPVDNNRAYMISHKSHPTTGRKYRMVQFFNPAAWVDTFAEGTAKILTTWKPRPFYVGPYRDNTGMAMKIINHVDFGDTDGLIISIEADESRTVLPTTYAQTRQSGVANTGMAAYRETEVIPLGDGIPGSRFTIETKKTVPADGDFEIHCPEIEVIPTQSDEEFLATIGTYPDTTFVVKADAVPEVDAYA